MYITPCRTIISVCHIIVLLFMIILSAPTSAKSESYYIPPYNVSFELRIDHEYGLFTELNNPDINNLNLYTSKAGQKARVTIKRFNDPQDVNSKIMENTIRNTLQDFRVSSEITISESEIDGCYCMIGRGKDGLQNSWVALYYWLNVNSNPDSKCQSALTSCLIMSNYPENILNEFIGTFHIES